MQTYTVLETIWSFGTMSQDVMSGTAIDLKIDQEIVDFLEINSIHESEDSGFWGRSNTSIVKGIYTLTEILEIV